MNHAVSIAIIACSVLCFGGCSQEGEPAMPGTGGVGDGGTGTGGSTGGISGSGGLVTTGGRPSGGAAATGGTSSGGAAGTPTGDGGSGSGGKGGGTGGAGAGGSAGGQGGQGGSGGGEGCAVVTVSASGAYSVTFKTPAWTFAGNLGAPAEGVTSASGTDKLGSYCDTAFTYTASGSRSGRIRAYAALPVVVFSESSTASVANTRNFPKLTTVPNLSHHITYGGGGSFNTNFINYQLSSFAADSPFVYFDDAANTFIVSGASHFTNTQTTASGGAITSGIQSNIATLPAGFETSTILVADPSYGHAYEEWGRALLSFTGKTLVGNDATPVLNKFGYWTDNGASYYYKTQAGADYQTTLMNVAKYFESNGVPLAYVQLDSWWYPKGSNQSWSDTSGGFYRYEAQKDLFPNGLAAFQKSLGLGFVTHNRWVDSSSPYRSQYKVSGNTVIDPAFWADRAAYLKSSGVLVYEQDWLSQTGLPNQTNLTDQDAYLDSMAKAMGDAGIDIQYCMPLARHILQSTKYNAVTNSRVSSDRFGSGMYRDFLHGSQLAWAVRLWPWTDVFMSGERDNLILSNLSAGLVGTGDAVNSANFTNIKRVIRPDGVIVKPDVPIVLTDKSIVADAKGGSSSLVASTYTQHGGGRFTYVYTFGGSSTSFTPTDFGYAGKVYVYDVINDAGKAVDAAQAYSGSNGYYLVAPIGASGIAFLGDRGKFVSLGKKRISAFTDDGTITATVQYATGEGPVTLQGMAAAAPTVSATSGTVGAVNYSASTQRFTVAVTAAGTSATVTIKP